MNFHIESYYNCIYQIEEFSIFHSLFGRKTNLLTIRKNMKKIKFIRCRELCNISISINNWMKF